MGGVSVYVSLGWWLAPALITLAAFVAVRIFGPRMRPNGGLGEMVVGLLELLAYGAAALVSLIAWLIWALVA